MPPTLAILAVVLMVAALIAQFLTPGEFERRDVSIKKLGTEWVAHIVRDGETLESIAVAEGSDPETLGMPSTVLPGEDVEPVPVTALVVGETVYVPRHPTETRRVVVPGTYPTLLPRDKSITDRVYHVLGSVFTAPHRGFLDKAGIIAFILIIGASFGIILATGAIDAVLHATVEKIGAAGLGWVAIPITMFVFSLCGATFGMSEEVIPFVMITIPMAFKLGYDSYTGISMSFVAAGLGFATGFFNPFTVQIAQGIAEVEVLSGWQYRVVLWIVATSIGVAYVMPYAVRVRKDPTLSPAYESDKELRARFSSATGEASGLTMRSVGVLLVLVATIVITSWGVIAYHWYLDELSGFFLAAGVLSAFVAGMPVGKAVEAFGKGASDLVGAALVVAFSAGIVQVLNDAHVMDTVLNFIASSMQGTHTVVGACLMYFFQTLMNVIVISGSGQAAMTMPIMAPLSDLIGVERQVAVLAFQFGDGFGNMILPTSAVTMSVLGIARIPWERWAWWILPLEIILTVFGCIALAIAVLTGYS